MAKIRIVGDSSGYVEIAAPNAAGNNTLELPSSGTRLVGSDNIGNVSVSGIVTATTFSGNVNSTSGVTTVTTLRATSIVGVTTAGITTAYIGAVNDGSISGARNKIINGDMRLDQRNGGASITVSGDPQYTLDRWAAGRGTVPNFTIIRSSTTPVGFTSSLLITMGTGTSPGVGGYAYLGHRIEGFNTSDLLWGTANAKPVTLSFWVNCSVSGTFGVSFRNTSNIANTTYCATYTINSTNTWEYKTITVPGVTTGTWLTDNSSGIEIYWDIGVGTLYSGTAGQVNTGGNYFGVSGTTKLCSTTGATFYLTGVQLEAGTVATPFERRSYGQELALCQRYFQYALPISPRLTQFDSFYNFGGFNLPLQVPMRAAPSITTMGNVTGTSNNNTGPYYSFDYVRTGATTTMVTLDVGYSNGKTLDTAGVGWSPPAPQCSAEL